MGIELNEQQILKELIHLLRIPSPSRREKDVASYIKDRCKEMGIQVMEDESMNVTGSNVGNLICSIKGSLPDKDPIYFTAHMDTIETKTVHPIIKNNYVITDGSTALGADNKVGIITLLEAINYIKQNNLPHGDVMFIFTVCEEEGMVGARSFDQSFVKGKIGYTVDADEPVGTLITESPSLSIGTITVRAENRGTADQVSQAVSSVIQSIHTFSIDQSSSLSIIGFKENTEQHLYAMDITVQLKTISPFYDQLFQDVLKECVQTVSNEKRVSITTDIEHICASYSYTSAHQNVQMIRSAIKKIGKEPVQVERDDVSDANVFTSKESPTLTIGAGYEHIHTNKERIACSEIFDLTRLMIALCTSRQ